MSLPPLPPDPYRARKRSQARRAIAMGVGAALALAVVLTTFVWRSLTEQVLDPETLCPEMSRVAAEWVFLIDVTDPISPLQRASILDEFQAIQDGIGPLERLTVFPLEGELEALIEPEISLCNPGSGEDACWVTQNPARLKSRWQEAFALPIARLLDETLARPPAPVSPIMEQIQAASITGYANNGAPRKLVVFSDLLQNSNRLSMYSGLPECTDLVSSPAFDALRADLRDVEVALFYIRRDGSPFASRPRDHIAFWECYFAKMGARVVRVRRITG